MIWAFAILAVVAALVAILRSRRSKSAAKASETLRSKAAMLPLRDRVQFAEDIRAMAWQGYDRASSAAIDAGKSAQFANEAGVLDAVYCVLANSDQKRADDSLRPALQMEGVPFNHLEPGLGRAAVAEYLVWRWLPNSADKDVLRRAFHEFRLVMLSKAESGDEMMFSELTQGDNYDWQELLRLTSFNNEGSFNA